MADATTTIRLWDLPVRLFHWGIALLVPAMWASFKAGDMDLHEKLGLCLLFLVTFRLVWGVIGGETARFHRFLRGPSALFAYLRTGRDGNGEPFLGHNPLGAFSVVALICLLLVQVALGLFAQDTDGIFSGPLSHFISYDGADRARELHELVFNLLLGLIAIHLSAIAFYAVFRKDRLVRPMLTGRKRFSEQVRQPAMAAPWRMVPALIVAGVVTSWVARGAPLPV